MALYLGGNKVKLASNGARYGLNVGSPLLIQKNTRLLSADSSILKDSLGRYLLPKQQARG